MKDRNQKQKLLKYFLSRGWYPQLEVDVFYIESTIPKPKIITDIDVLGLAPNSTGLFQNVIGDCKTLKNQSPINRAFWIKGLMNYFSSNHGVVLLLKPIESEHKLLANELGVSLLSEEDFKTFSIATSSQEVIKNAAIAKYELWDIYFDIPNRLPNLLLLHQYCRSGFWNERDYNIRLRHSIARLRKVGNEMNPENVLCMFLFLEMSSQFSIAINALSITIFNKYLWPSNKDVFDKDLKIHLWGGFDNYNLWNDMRNRLYAAHGGEETGLALPEWNIFVNLVRACLDKPLSTALTSIILKELAFCCLEEQESLTKWDYLSDLLKKDSYSAKMAVQIIDYLSKAAKMPKEFSDTPIGMLMKLQRK